MKLTSSKTMRFGLNDTIIGTVMNWPLNVLVFMAVEAYSISPVWAATYTTIIFFIIAILRKAVVAYYVFEKSNKVDTYDAEDPGSWGV